jgi:excinuclease ABC subunit A
MAMVGSESIDSENTWIFCLFYGLVRSSVDWVRSVPVGGSVPEPFNTIELRQVETNNLRKIDVAIPMGKLTVVTGVSGSGKSSLVFDTLYAESYRRYVESLSSFARQYMKALPKPKLASVERLPASIAVRQSRSGTTSRSTVGTLTELGDVLRILFTHLSSIHCRICSRVVERETGESVARKILGEKPAGGGHAPVASEGQRALILAPLAAWGKLPAKELKAQLAAQGFSRIDDDGEILRLEDVKAPRLGKASVVVDRITVQQGVRARLATSAQLALKLGRGRMLVRVEGVASPVEFSSGLTCCGVEYRDPTLALFSFNHPLGACSHCQGFGWAQELDWDKIFPDKSKSLADAGVAPWNFGRHTECYEWAAKSARASKIPVSLLKKPFDEFNAAEWKWLKFGEGSKTDFNGVTGYFAWLDTKRYKMHYRIHAARYRKYVTCGVCGGGRLGPDALVCKLLGLSITEVSRKSVLELAAWLKELKTHMDERSAAAGGATAGKPLERGLPGVAEAWDEAEARVRYLLKIGLGYLSLDRSSRTLSGGELQRISMARCLGSALTDTLFCLDEPSAGLHASDSQNLLEVLQELRAQGNTVVVVEHERTIIRGADHYIEIGPKAGHEGGWLVSSGRPVLLAAPKPKVASNPVGAQGFLEIKKAATHNLRGIDVRIPVGALTAVCGVSGSGKTSLIQHTFCPLVAEILGSELKSQGTSVPVAQSVGPKALVKKHGEILLMSQAALGRSSRSNIATYLGVMDEIRKLLASTPLAKQLGLTPGSFSFNTPGGRCETCRGLGLVTEDLSFLGEMDVSCPTCQGRRFGDDVLSVRWKNRNLLELLTLTVAEARSFFFDRPQLVRILDIVIDMGLGYLTLGQNTSSFSGGEAQRLKLVEVLLRTAGGKPGILIFDEPTTGLSDTDTANLLDQLRKLTRAGHTVIVVEHHLDVLRQADWLIEIGPGAAAAGGELVYEGPPAGLKIATKSMTRPWLFGEAQ